MEWTDEKIQRFADLINRLAAISEPPEDLEIGQVVRRARARERFWARSRNFNPSFRDVLMSSGIIL